MERPPHSGLWFSELAIWPGGIIQGKPSVACGADSVAYVAVRDDWNSLWLARVQGNNWLGWSYGGGIMSGDPQAVAARDGTVYAVLRGRSQANELWWYRLANSLWSWAGYQGAAAGPLAAAPR